MTDPVDPTSTTAALLVNITSDPAEVAPLRHQVETFCRDAGFSDVAVGDIGLCLNEALANVINHAYGGERGQPIEVTATLADSKVVVAIRDWGSGTHPGQLPQTKSDPLQPGGLGLICLGRLMDRVSFTPQRPKGMLLEMVRHR